MPNRQADLAPRIRLSACPVLSALLRTAPQLSLADMDRLLGEVVAKVLSQASSGMDVRDLDTYAKRIARNSFYSQIRGKVRVMAVQAREHGQEGDRLAPWLADLVGISEWSTSAKQSDDLAPELVIQAFERLRPLECSILVLRYGYGLSSEDVAGELGYKNRAVVDATSARARMKLKRHLLLHSRRP